ncbi:MAG: hypothetical protein J5965_05990 [Aeriscardovia sp.]|nr:hypothetical protein [Aeriscardovia sp.]
MNEHYDEIPSLSEDQESDNEDLKTVDMVPSEDQLLEDDNTDTDTDEDDETDNAVEDETDENDDEDSIPLDEQEEQETMEMDPTTARHHAHHYADSMMNKEHTTTPGTLNLHLNLHLDKEGEQSMSRRKAALTVDEVNEQNHVKDTGYNFQSAQDRPATLEAYDLTNEPHRDFDNMQGQTSIYSMRATATTAMRLAARMLKHGLRDGDVDDPVDVADVADEIRDTMSEGEARDKADILKELDDKNDDEIREIEHEIHDDKDHEKMDRKDIKDDEKHLDRLEKARRHARRRKASYDDLDVDRDYLHEFLDHSDEWAALLNQLSVLDEDELSELDDDELERLENGLEDFVFQFSDRSLDKLNDVHEMVEDMLEEDGPLFAARHSRRRRAEADERTVCDVRMTKDGDYEARCDGKVKRFDKKGDALEWLSDHFDDSYHDSPEFKVKHDESRRARRRHAEADERTVCDVRMTKDGDYEARCDGKVKRFDKKGDALEWLSDHFDDSYKDEPEFKVKDDKEARQARLQKLITAHRKQVMSSRQAASKPVASSVRMASTMSPAKNDISSILL